MKNSVKILSFAVVFVIILSLCGCGKKSGKTLIYGNIDLSKYIRLGEYKGISIDKSLDEFKTAYENILSSDADKIGTVEKVLEGTVKEGDTVNIDYEGKKDGVAFSGGTAQGKDLTIGSGQFIPGFESGLIGVKVGDTVDLNLTFPSDYHSAELAGAAVVFTVKVNYIKGTGVASIEKSYGELGFGSFEEYKADAEKRAAQNLLFQKVLNNSEVLDYPEADRNAFIDAVYDYMVETYKTAYGVDFDTVLSRNGMTAQSYKESRKQSSDSQIKDQLVYYGILEKENLKAEYELTAGEKTNQPVLDEIKMVEHVVRDFLYENAKIK